jgi:hypothetical protein
MRRLAFIFTTIFFLNFTFASDSNSQVSQNSVPVLTLKLDKINSKSKLGKQISQLIKREGSLAEGHTLKSLGDGAFRLPGVCNGKDLIWITFDGLEIKVAKNSDALLSTYGGTAGSWSYLYIIEKPGTFKKVYDAQEQGIFRGIVSHQELVGSRTGSDCPNMKVDLHGSYCNKGGAEPCFGTLNYDGQKYTLGLPRAP